MEFLTWGWLIKESSSRNGACHELQMSGWLTDPHGFYKTNALIMIPGERDYLRGRYRNVNVMLILLLVRKARFHFWTAIVPTADTNTTTSNQVTFRILLTKSKKTSKYDAWKEFQKPSTRYLLSVDYFEHRS